MIFDLAFTYIDCGDIQADWYAEAATMMVNSARKAFSGHSMRVVHLTSDNTPQIDNVDVRRSLGHLDPNEFAKRRGMLNADWALETENPTILCDVDMLWNPNDAILELFNPACGIILTTRKGMGVQPFNGGLIMTQPGQTEFWTTYKSMLSDSLPRDISRWWGDQIAFSAMLGLPEERKSTFKFGSRIGYVPASLLAPAPKSQPTEITNTPAVHFKGVKKRKPWMPEYYRLLESTQV